jgi:hypothetical protein
LKWILPDVTTAAWKKAHAKRFSPFVHLPLANRRRLSFTEKQLATIEVAVTSPIPARPARFRVAVALPNR